MNKQALKQLKKELLQKQKEKKVLEQEANQQRANNSLDHTLFREAMSEVTPLHSDRVHHAQKVKRVQTFRLIEDEVFEVDDPLSDELEIEDTDFDEVLSYCQTGIQNKVFRKLRSGGYRISDELDLHGATVKQAKEILLYYLQEAVQFEGCCVRIIHGKGHRSDNNKPVLKTYVNHWLQEHERVLAFHSAKTKDGGSGAVYVLLRRN